MPVAMKTEKSSWRLCEGDEIAPGRTVVRPMGGGERFEVYLAWEDRMFSLVVAKLLRPDRVDNERSRRALDREARLLERLAHPVLLRGFGAVPDGPRPHLLLEHLEGPTLRSLIKRGPVSPEQLAPTAVALAGALHYLHGEGVVHLDIKPANVLMGMPPRLIDLSLARRVERATATRVAVGTPSYMPPEQLDPLNRGPMGPPADVFGLGATLYHAAAARKPFSSRRVEPWLDAEPPPLPADVPSGLAEPILACLRPNPAERPTARELAVGLEPVAERLGARRRNGRWRRR